MVDNDSVIGKLGDKGFVHYQVSINLNRHAPVTEFNPTEQKLIKCKNAPRNAEQLATVL